MKTVILDWDTLTVNGDISAKCFEDFGEVEIYGYTPPELAAERTGSAEIVLCNKTPITAEVIESCPNLKYIGLFATGYNNVDIEKATQKGICVCNAGSYSTDAVAQQTFAYILHFYSKVCKYDCAVREGEWIKSPLFSYFPYPVSELSGKTLSIIGFGSIGRAVAEIGKAFKMNVIVSTRTVPDDKCGFEFVSTDEAFSRANVLTIHCPLNKQSENLVCLERLKLMKPSAIVINTSRGAVVNENDLAFALENGIIAGAAVDVLVKEPMSPDTPLKNAPNCIITPHTAWAAYETRKRLVSIVYENIEGFINGRIKNKVN